VRRSQAGLGERAGGADVSNGLGAAASEYRYNFGHE
jgi:hypothetical protein